MTVGAFQAIQGAVGPGNWPQASFGPPGDVTVAGCRRLYYPYDWTLFRCRANTWLGATGMNLACLVDCRTGVAATTDPFATERVAAGDALVMDRRIDPETALRLARRYAAYAIRQKHKALVLPRLEVVERRSVYKPFWVVDTRSKNGRPQTLLIDGLTGEHCTLPAGSRADCF